MIPEKYQTDLAAVMFTNPFNRLPPLRYLFARPKLEKYLSCMSQSPVPGTPSSRLLSLSSHSPLIHHNKHVRMGTPIRRRDRNGTQG